MRLLFFGTYDASAHPRVAVLRDGLRDRGARVEECNVPLGLTTAARVGILRNPALLPLLGWRIVRCWARLWRASRPYRRSGDRPDAVVVGYLGHFDVLLARRLFPDVPVVLDHLIGASDTARDRGVRSGLRQRLLQRLDDGALRAADVVVVDTDEHREALPVSARRRAVVVEVGAPVEWFSPPMARFEDPGDRNRGGGKRDDAEPAEAMAPLRVVFFGLFTPLQGTPVIARAISALGDEPVEVTMIGSGQDYDEARQNAAGNARVSWRDWVEPADLPALVARHDVCLGIFGTGAKAARVVPNKVFQGAAAGCALVTSDTPPQRRLLGEAAVLVPPGDSGALAAELRSLAHDRHRLARLRAAARALAGERFTPAAVVSPLHARLHSLVPPQEGFR